MKKSIFTLMLFYSISIYAEIRIVTLSNQEIEDAIYAIGKIAFQDDHIYLVAQDGTILGSDKISNLRSLVFINSTSTLPNVESSNIRIYPNPTQDVILISGIEDAATIRVYALNGKCLQSANGNQIDVRDIPNGYYILQVNMQIFKFIKK